MPAVSRLLPAAIALALTGTLVGGGVAAADLRADEQRAEAERQRVAAAEALARAEADYRTAVGALAEEVFDQVEPLQQTVERVLAVDDGSFTVLSDVSRGGGVDALKSVRTRLGEIVPPPTLADGHRRLDAGLDALVRGSTALVNSVDPDLGEDSFFRELVRGDDSLDSGVRIFNDQLEELYAGGSVPSLPGETGAGKAGRPATSKAAYLYGVGALCAGTSSENPDDPAGLRRDAAELRDLLRGLVAVPAPPADAELVRTSIAEHVERGNAIVEGLEGAATAIDRRDDRALAAAEVQLERGSLALDQAADGFGAYGSETCKISFSSEEDGEEEPERPA